MKDTQYFPKLKKKTEETVRKGQEVMPVCNFVNLCATAVRVSDKYQQTDSKLFVL